MGVLNQQCMFQLIFTKNKCWGLLPRISNSEKIGTLSTEKKSLPPLILSCFTPTSESSGMRFLATSMSTSLGQKTLTECPRSINCTAMAREVVVLGKRITTFIFNFLKIYIGILYNHVFQDNSNWLVLVIATKVYSRRVAHASRLDQFIKISFQY